MIDKVPPHNLEAERAVIGAMLLERDARIKAGDILQTEAFYDDRHRIIFEAILYLENQDKPVDLITIGDELRVKGSLEQVGGRSYIGDLLAETFTAVNVEQYAWIVQRCHIKRQVIVASQRNLADAYREDIDSDELLATTQERLFSIKQARLTGLEHWGHGLIDELERLKKARDSHQVQGIPTGFKDLDDATGGLEDETLIVVAARPSMGKTAFALGMARNIAEKQKRVAVFSLEMSKQQLYQRMACMEVSMNLLHLRNLALSDEQWERIFRKAPHLASLPVHIDDTPRLTSLEIRSKARRLKAEGGLDVVVIDYVGLIGDQPHKQWSKSDYIGTITGHIKQMAKELKVPVILLCQLNRDCEDRVPPRPMLSDLRDSGNIEEHADVVLLLYRDEYYNEKSDAQGIAEIIIAKQRNGPTGAVYLQFAKEFARFGNLAQKYTLPPPKQKKRRRRYPDEEE